MGRRAIEKMVKALAAAWQRSAREHESELPECAFHCYVEHQRVPSPSMELYSGVQCILLPVSTDWHTTLKRLWLGFQHAREVKEHLRDPCRRFRI